MCTVATIGATFYWADLQIGCPGHNIPSLDWPTVSLSATFIWRESAQVLYLLLDNDFHTNN